LTQFLVELVRLFDLEKMSAVPEDDQLGIGDVI
jgi:hypothetical protein